MEFKDKEIKEYVNCCFPWMDAAWKKECIKAGKEARAKYDSTPSLQARDRDQYIRSAICWKKSERYGFMH